MNKLLYCRNEEELLVKRRKSQDFGDTEMLRRAKIVVYRRNSTNRYKIIYPLHHL